MSNSRVIFMPEHLEGEATIKVISQLVELIEEDNEQEKIDEKYNRKPIKIYINTCGGDVTDGLAIIDIIKSSKTPIYTYAIGACFSMGVRIFVCGHKRFIGRHTTLLIHQVVGATNGSIMDIDSSFNHYKHLNKMIDSILITNSSLKYDQLEEMYKYNIDCYFYADEAIEFKIADEYI